MSKLTKKTNNLVQRIFNMGYDEIENIDNIVREYSSELSEYMGSDVRIEIASFNHNLTSIRIYISTWECVLYIPVISDSEGNSCDLFFTDYNGTHKDSVLTIKFEQNEYQLSCYNNNMNIHEDELDDFSTELYISEILSKYDISYNISSVLRIMRLYRGLIDKGFSPILIEFSTEPLLQEKLCTMYEHIF